MIEPVPGIDQTTKDYVQIFNWLVTSVGGATAATIALLQMRRARQQRVEELRWKKASTALELMTQIHRNPHSYAAIHMLDWWGAAHIELRDGDRVISTTTAEIERVLSEPRSSVAVGSDQFITDAFDWFFYFIDRVAHLESITLVEPGDVEPIFAPYLGRLRAKRELFMPIIEAQGYRSLARMLDGARFI